MITPEVVEPVSLDLETASEVDLSIVGTYAYARHPSTVVLCAVARWLDEGQRELWQVFDPASSPELIDMMRTRGVSAWNAAFEREIWEQVGVLRMGWPVLSEHVWHCTMAEALSINHPGELDRAALALQLFVRKDAEGKRLMRKMAKADGPRDESSVARLVQYCATDTLVEKHAWRRLPRLSHDERALWMVDQDINRRGIRVDVQLARVCVEIDHEHRGYLARRAHEAHGVKLTEVERIRMKLRGYGLPLDNLRADTCRTALEVLEQFDPSSPACDLLRLRADASAISPRKFTRLLSVLQGDDRARGMFQYHGAGQTGRWAGRNVQLQNLPRPTLKRAEVLKLADKVREGLLPPVSMRAGGMDVLTVLNDLLRPVFIPTGSHFTIGDLEQIEARVLAWCAGETRVLAAFREGRDIYVEAYAQAFRVPPEIVSKAQRQIGKVMVLALGYGGGAHAFVAMGRLYGVRVEEAEANRLKTLWRESRPATVGWWRALEHAALAAVNTPGRVCEAGPVSFAAGGNALWCRLPSGRRLCYPSAHLALRVPPWEAALPREQQTPRPTLAYYTPLGATMTRDYTHAGKLAENVVQAISRDALVPALMKAPDAVLHAHDEVVLDGRHPELLADLMSMTPAWAPGLPVAAKVYMAPRYVKDD